MRRSPPALNFKKCSQQAGRKKIDTYTDTDRQAERKTNTYRQTDTHTKHRQTHRQTAGDGGGIRGRSGTQGQRRLF